nr:immunoglobulin light chain junction region [Macaca mulatta]MOW43967.1 immunoglobulin light chain junction region [Macaca mulatta]MOW44415.1 immunoglobulin light chain junction region [Macaca mulatta]MOW44861.1 immunoglobulin light chain junction region [Macaca mulatta]
CQQDYSYPFTF